MYNEVFIAEAGLGIDLTLFDLIDTNIDFTKSFEKLLKHHLMILLRHVYDTTYDHVATPPTSTATSQEAPTTWSSILFQKFHQLVEAIIKLARLSIRNADVHFTNMVTQKLRQAVVSQNMVNNPMFFGIFDNFIHTQVQQTLVGIRGSSSDVKEFVLYKEGTLQAASELAVASGHQESQLNNVEDDEVYDDATSSLSDMDVDSSFNNYKKDHPEIFENPSNFF